MAQEITKTYYTILELSPDIREKVLEKHRDINIDYDWHEFLIDDFKEELTSMGFNNPKISFSGFWSQGDGLSFECDSLDLGKLFNHIDVPKPHHIQTYQAIFTGSIDRINSRYSHERTCRLSLGYQDYYGHHIRPQRLKRLNSIIDDLYSRLDDLYVDMCSKFYRALEKEYNYLTSEDLIIETLNANEFLFDDTGRPL